MTGKKSSVTGKFNYLPVMTGILSRIISRPGWDESNESKGILQAVAV